MLRELEDRRQDIRNTRIKDENFEGCIIKCKSYIKTLNSLSDINKNDDLRFVYHELALDNKKLGNIDTSIRYCLVAITYTNHNKGDCDYRYINSIWLLAECYLIKGNIGEALKLYHECARLYKILKEKKLRVCTLFNIARATKNSKAMIKLIKIYETQKLGSVVKTYGDMEDNVLKEMYSNLIDLYMLNGKANLAFQLLFMIRNENLKKELGKKLEVA